MEVDLKAWSGPADTWGMQALASRCWPQGLHPGGLGWSLATDQLAESIVLASSVGGAVDGWAGVTQPGTLTLQVSPGQPEIRAALIEWLIDTATGPELTIDVFDDETQQDLIHAGFETSAPPFGYYRMGSPGLRVEVDSLAALPPDGYSIRSVRPDEADGRVAVHRASWRPADLPFDPDHRPELDESASSSFTLEIYRRAQHSALYDLDLDLLAVAPDGSLAGCCIGWFDSTTGWAEIEPLGVVPAHRRRGLAIAMCSEVARRVASFGGRHVFINTGASQVYPAPYLAYTKAGFVPFVRSTILIRH